MKTNTKKYILPCMTALLTTTAAHAVDHSQHAHMNHSSADSYTPVQVMGTHSHSSDEWMLSYRYARMEMKGFKQGNDNISPAEVYAAGYTAAPVKMTNDMHMFSAMKGLTDDFTVMAMTSYQEKEMSVRTAGGATFNTSAEGFGDTKVSLIDNLNRYGYTNWSTMVTLSIPTGSIDEEQNTPMGTNTRLPYPMQLGSGTYDITPAVTYQCECRGIQFGTQAFATFRIGENEEDYRLGNEFGAKAWAGKVWNKTLSTGVTASWLTQNGISGSDSHLNPNMVVTADAENSGFDKATLAFDVSYKPAVLKGVEILGAYEEPIYQDFDGIQMESKRTFTLGLRKTF